LSLDKYFRLTNWIDKYHVLHETDKDGSLTLDEMVKLASEGLGMPVTPAHVERAYQSLDMQAPPKKKRRRKRGTYHHRNHTRALAKIISELFVSLGMEVPDDLLTVYAGKSTLGTPGLTVVARHVLAIYDTFDLLVPNELHALAGSSTQSPVPALLKERQPVDEPTIFVNNDDNAAVEPKVEN
jgi:hypothetical protein|tara:strand:- start:808 stop:1356 length:549 start_codon:yes stop_codon:yes gene_type:complete